MVVDVLTVMENGAPKLPPMDAPGGYCLHYVDSDGNLAGGFSMLHQVPLVPNTCVTRVWCSAAVFDQMILDPVLDIQWWEEVVENAPTA